MMRTLIALTVLTLALGAACKKKEEAPAPNPRCRLFEISPASADPGTLAELRQAYDDLQLLAECAKAAKFTVEEFSRRYQVQQRAQDVARRIGAGAGTVLGEARGRIREVREGAERALDQSVERVEQGIEQVRALAE